MTRNPARCMRAGIAWAALLGSRLSPTTARLRYSRKMSSVLSMSSGSSAGQQCSSDPFAVADHDVGQLAEKFLPPARRGDIGQKCGILRTDVGRQLAKRKLHRRRKLEAALLDPLERQPCLTRQLLPGQRRQLLLAPGMADPHHESRRQRGVDLGAKQIVGGRQLRALLAEQQSKILAVGVGV